MNIWPGKTAIWVIWRFCRIKSVKLDWNMLSDFQQKPYHVMPDNKKIQFPMDVNLVSTVPAQNEP
jgi:hypothetical protein